MSTVRSIAMQGTVDRVAADEGFGFIIGPNGEEYFFHRTALKGADWDELGPGVVVTFRWEEGVGDRPDEHLRAVDVHLTPDAVPAVDNEPLPQGKLSGE
jgi:cold shock CspA family protein